MQNKIFQGLLLTTAIIFSMPAKAMEPDADAGGGGGAKASAPAELSASSSSSGKEVLTPAEKSLDTVARTIVRLYNNEWMPAERAWKEAIEAEKTRHSEDEKRQKGWVEWAGGKKPSEVLATEAASKKNIEQARQNVQRVWKQIESYIQIFDATKQNYPKTYKRWEEFDDNERDDSLAAFMETNSMINASVRHIKKELSTVKNLL